VDLVVFHGTVEELQAFFGLDEVQPQPSPEPTELKLALQEIAALKNEMAELVKRASAVVLAVGDLSILIS